MNRTRTVTETRPLILRLLLEQGHLESGDVKTALEVQLKENLSLEEVLVREQLVDERKIAQAYSSHFLLPWWELAPEGPAIDPQLAQQLPENLCRNYHIAPVAIHDDALDVAFCSPAEFSMVDEVQLLTGRTVCPAMATLSDVEKMVAKLYEDSAWSGSTDSNGASDDETSDGTANDVGDDEIVRLDQPPPPGRDGLVIRYVNQLLEQALRVGASDIHIEHFEGLCRARLRVDGRLSESTPPTPSMYNAIVARIKVLAKMDIAEKRTPQDGAIAVKSVDKRVDMRVNTVPTVHGEKVVMRVLDRGAIPLKLSDLGLDERQSTDLVEAIRMPHGLMLVTGPTGSGKSTTLYACLNLLNKAAVNRLQDMGIEPFLLASTLRGLLAQRLIRRLCPKCKKPYECDEETARPCEFEVGQKVYQPGGCRECRDAGFRGRVGIFEVIRITNNLAQLIQKRTPLPDLRRAADEEGMKSLRQSALDKVKEAATSIENALAITVSEE